MSQHDWGIFNIFKDWILVIAALAATILLAPMTRVFLRRFHASKTWRFAHDLAVPLSLLIYPIGLRIALDAAPVNEKLAHRIENAIYVFFVLAFSNLLRQGALIAIEWGTIKGPRNSETLQSGFIPLLRNVVSVIVFTMAGIMMLKYFGYDVMSLVTALGVSSLAVGLAAKDTLSNMISGFTLIIDRNLRPGDKINLGGVIGDVQEIGLRSTLLNTGDGNVLIVPNQDLVNTKILNMSLLGSGCSCTAKFRVALDTPFDLLKKICDDIFQEIPAAWKEKGAALQLSSVMDGQQLLSFGFWVSDQRDSDSALTEFQRKLIERLKSAGIALLSAPQRSV